MSRIIAAIILAFAITGLCITDRLTVNNTCDVLYEKVLACEENGVFVSELEKLYDDKYSVLSLFVNHNDLDEISQSVVRLNSFSGDINSDFFVECALIKSKLDDIKKDSGINWHSVF